MIKQQGREFMDVVDVVGIAKDAETLADIKPKDDFYSYRSTGEELQTAFFDVLEAWKSEHSPIILVDDLDRCPRDRAIDLLDAIRTLLSAMTQPGVDEANQRKIPHFLVARDRDMMEDAISQKFAGSLSDQNEAITNHPWSSIHKGARQAFEQLCKLKVHLHTFATREIVSLAINIFDQTLPELLNLGRMIRVVDQGKISKDLPDTFDVSAQKPATPGQSAEEGLLQPSAISVKSTYSLWQIFNC